jgi:hypothetical protein
MAEHESERAVLSQLQRGVRMEIHYVLEDNAPMNNAILKWCRQSPGQPAERFRG